MGKMWSRLENNYNRVVGQAYTNHLILLEYLQDLSKFGASGLKDHVAENSKRSCTTRI